MNPSDLAPARERAAGLAYCDNAADGVQLSVAELQRAYRELLHDVRGRRLAGPTRTSGPSTTTRDQAETHAVWTDSDRADAPDVPMAWVAVLAAQSGAGASTVALALADAAANDDRPVHLIESAHPTRSGLVGASRSELGIDVNGMWRRGRRGHVTIDRRAHGIPAADWPTWPHDADQMTIVDLGLPSPAQLSSLATSRASCIVVCRATVPGARATERILDALAELRVVVALLGAGRWPGEVTASLGPRTRRLRDDGQVVTVPIGRRVEVSGLTEGPLPKTLLAAGRSLLNQTDTGDARRVAAEARRATPTKGTTR